MLVEALFTVVMTITVPPDNSTPIAIERIEKLAPGLDITKGTITLTGKLKRKPMVLQKGTYIGSFTQLQKKTALIRKVTKETLLAQFDDLALPAIFTHGWVSYPRKDFKLIED